MSSANEFGRLFQGIGVRIADPTNTCFFIHKHKVLQDCFRDATYSKFECLEQPQKIDKLLRTRSTIRENCINYMGNVGTPTA